MISLGTSPTIDRPQPNPPALSRSLLPAAFRRWLLDQRSKYSLGTVTGIPSARPWPKGKKALKRWRNAEEFPVKPSADPLAPDSGLAPSRTAAESIGQIPALALLAALQGSGRAVILFDAALQIIHRTSDVDNLLGAAVEPDRPASSIVELLRQTQLDSSSISAARQAIMSALQMSSRQETLPVSSKLSRNDGNKALQITVKNLGSSIYAAFFEFHQPAVAPAAAPLEEADHLTGLAMRRQFERELRDRLLECRPAGVAVLLMDLDRFKQVNDSHGHLIGDALLHRVGERLQKATRQGDLVARFGGDEFAVLLRSSCSHDEAVVIATRIVDLIGRSYLIEGQPISVGASVGLAFAPDHGTDSATLLRNADLAMYESKRQGRSRACCFDSTLLDSAVARYSNERDLRKALPARQFELHYQPQVTVDGTLCGFEALIRWRHPERGLIPPAEFLPTVEEIGLMDQVGSWVLITACKEATKWPGDLVVAINAAPSQLEKPGFADCVRDALKMSRLPGCRLEIEITEGALLSQGTVVMETLQRLRELGVKIAIDDFGTGYASLSQLSQFPFDKIKLDRSLAGFDGNNLKKRAIVRAVTSLGQSLGMTVLAEGVETVEQMDRLKLDGCSTLQGYYLGRPSPASQIEGIRAHFATPVEPENNTAESNPEGNENE